MAAQEASDEKSNAQINLAVITGVSRGMGKAMAIELIEQGFTVAGCARDKNKLDQLTKEYGTKGVGNHDFSPVDLTNAESVETWSKNILKKYNNTAPTLLINNAGWAHYKKDLESMEDKDMKNSLLINTFGPFLVCKSFLPIMKEQKCDDNNNNNNKDSVSVRRIIFMSSGLGVFGMGGYSGYCASKYGLEGLNAALSKELPQHILCCCYSPGTIATDMFAQAGKNKGLKTDYSMDYMKEKGMITSQEFAKQAIPHILGLQRKDANGAHVDSPVAEKSLKSGLELFG